MPRATVVVPHQLGQETALQRIQGKAEAVKAAFGGDVKDLHDEWHDNKMDFSFKASGFKISGAMLVQASDVRVDIELPLLAMAFKGMVERKVQEELGKILS